MLHSRFLTETVKQSQSSFGGSSDWSEIEGAWVLKPRNLKPKMVVHFIGGIYVGATPQLTYRLFLERLAEKREDKHTRSSASTNSKVSPSSSA